MNETEREALLAEIQRQSEIDWALRYKVLEVMLETARQEWMHFCEQDLDGNFCCDGYMCGCQGSSVREMWTWQVEREHRQHSPAKDD